MINEIWVYGPNRKVTSIIDRFSSCRVTTRFFENGDFEFKVPFTKDNVNDLRLRYYIRFPGIRGAFFITSRKAVKKNNEAYLQVSGKECTWLMSKRVVLDVPVFTSHSPAFAVNYAIGKNMLSQSGTRWIDYKRQASPHQYVTDKYGSSRALPFLKVWDNVSGDISTSYRQTFASGGPDRLYWAAFENLETMVRSMQVQNDVGMRTAFGFESEVSGLPGVEAEDLVYIIELGTDRSQGDYAQTINLDPGLDNVGSYEYVETINDIFNFKFVSKKIDWERVHGPHDTSNVKDVYWPYLKDGWVCLDDQNWHKPRYKIAADLAQAYASSWSALREVKALSDVNLMESHSWVNDDDTETEKSVWESARKKAWTRYPKPNDPAYMVDRENEMIRQYIAETRYSMTPKLYSDLYSQNPPFAISLEVDPFVYPVANTDYHAGDIVVLNTPEIGRQRLRVTEITASADAGTYKLTPTLQHIDVPSFQEAL